MGVYMRTGTGEKAAKREKIYVAFLMTLFK